MGEVAWLEEDCTADGLQPTLEKISIYFTAQKASQLIHVGTHECAHSFSCVEDQMSEGWLFLVVPAVKVSKCLHSDLVVLNWQLDLIILNIFSNLNIYIILSTVQAYMLTKSMPPAVLFIDFAAN